jgi:hypothetical protein
MNDVLTQEFNIGDILLNIVTLASSAIVIIGTVSTHAKKIVLKDIKNPALKRSLIRAGLYFNKDGKLVKRMEEVIKIDIDGDNKIGDKDMEEFPRENLLQGLKRSSEEFATIVAFKPEELEDVDALIEENNMVETATGLQEIKDSMKKSREQFTLEDAAETATATKEFLETKDGQKLQNKTNEIIKGTSLKTANTFKKAAITINYGIMTALSFIGNSSAKSIKFIFNGFTFIGGKVKNGIINIGNFFKKIFSRNNDPEQEETLAKILASKKIEKNEKLEVKKTVEQPKETTKPKTKSPTPAPKKAKAKLDPLEALREKYGR